MSFAGVATLSETVIFLENERRLLALEIHDVISQALATLYYRVQMCEYYLDADPARLRTELAEVRRLSQRVLDDTTQVLYNLRPPVLDQGGVMVAVRRYVVEFRRETGIEVAFTAPDAASPLGDLHEIFLYRIVQESLTNVRRHSGATRVEVSLHHDSAGIRGTIRDNGTGCDAMDTASQTARHHFGIRGMRDRAALLGGCLEVQFTSGRGTAVTFWIPLTREPADAPHPSARISEAEDCIGGDGRNLRPPTVVPSPQR